MSELKCETGCMRFDGGEVRHHKDCVYYPTSFTKMAEDCFADLQAARAEVERLKAQDLTHAVIASDIKLREERDALAAKLKVARGALEFSLEGLAMWRKFQSPGNIAEVEERIRQALAEIGENGGA